MFENLIESTRNKKRSRWAYFLMTSAIWMMTFTAVIISGIAVVDAQLSESVDITELISPPPPPAPPAGPTNHQQRTNRESAVRPFTSYEQSPRGIQQPPPGLRTIPLPLGPVGDNDYGVVGGDPNGDPKGVIGGLPTTSTSTTPPPPPPRPDPPKTETPTQPPPQKTVVRSVILQGTAINRVYPPYPPLALAAGVGGAVVVEVTIDEQGNVALARVLSGHPLLRDVSRNAAMGWKWKPTTLNGVAVKVIGTITFNFPRSNGFCGHSL